MTKTIDIEQVKQALAILGAKADGILGLTYTITIGDEVYGDPYVVDVNTSAVRIQPDKTVDVVMSEERIIEIINDAAEKWRHMLDQSEVDAIKQYITTSRIAADLDDVQLDAWDEAMLDIEELYGK